MDIATLGERIARLPLDRKVRLLTGATMFTLHGDDEIGLAPMAFSDGPTGVRGLDFTSGPTTCLFPNATLLASSWRAETAAEVGRLLAEEAERQHIHVVLGPTVNLHRTPLGGRLFEAYSEDPLLTGHLAAAYVSGLQAQGIGACVKHLVANESETDRQLVDSVLDERTLRELYLLPFEIAVEDADPWSVMAAYNDVNGVAATEQDHVINEILKGEWRWRGLVMSDWFATRTTAASANGGLDLVMPGPEGPWGPALVAAVEAGEVDEAVVDDHLRRLLLLAARVGAVDEHRSWRTGLPDPGGAVRREQLTRLAAEGMTVLANDGVLPLARGATLALIGRPALETTCMGGGSAAVRAPHQVSVADGLRAATDGVTVVDGVAVRSRPRAALPGVLTDPLTGAPGMRVRRYGASGTLLAETLSDEARTVGAMPDEDLPEPVTRVVLSATVPAGAMRVGVLGVGTGTVTIGAESHEVTLGSESGDVGGDFLRPPGWTTDVVLPEPRDLVADLTARRLVRARPGRGADPACRRRRDRVRRGRRGGRRRRGRGRRPDRGAGDRGVRQGHAGPPRSPGRARRRGRGRRPAHGRGRQRRHAGADALAGRGRRDPLGRAARSGGWARRRRRPARRHRAGRAPGHLVPGRRWLLPRLGRRPDRRELRYDEGVHVGYRGYAARRAPAPAYWFGEGLGYGEWEYGEVSVAGGVVAVDLTNVSARRSREVVQVYLEPDPEERDDQPVRLVGWTTVDLAAGEQRRVEVTVDPRAARTWTDDGWRPLTSGRLLVARGLGDLRGEVPFTPRSR